MIDFTSIFTLAPVGMCVSEHRTIRACNDALAAMFGYAKEELVGQSFLALYPSNDEFERTGQRIVPIMNEKGLYADDRIMMRKNHDLFWCHVSGRSLDKTNVHAAGIWAFEDLSKKRKVRVTLTPREREVATLLADGLTSKHIARALTLSPRTVEMHRAKLMHKFDAATSSELVNKLLDSAT